MTPRRRAFAALTSAAVAALAACDGPPGALGGDAALPADAYPHDARPADAAPVADAARLPDAGATDLPNLRPILAYTHESLELQVKNFPLGDCAVVEGCTLPGKRRLLRFDTVITNDGPVDLVLGAPPPDGTSSGDFEWSMCHGHHHYRGFAIYELLDGNGDVVRAGKSDLISRKQAFCLTDTLRLGASAKPPGSPQCTPSTPPGTPCLYNCTYQGISSGYADRYAASLACQWIDICGVPAGDYTLRVRVNPEGTLPESRTDDNVILAPVTIDAVVDPTLCAP